MVRDAETHCSVFHEYHVLVRPVAVPEVRVLHRITGRSVASRWPLTMVDRSTSRTSTGFAASFPTLSDVPFASPTVHGPLCPAETDGVPVSVTAGVPVMATVPETAAVPSTVTGSGVFT